MAVHLEGTTKRFIGLSSDRKPALDFNLAGEDGVVPVMTERDLPAGSSFLESDTGRIWRFDGNEWALPAVSDDGLLLLREIVAQFKALGEKIEEGLG